ncbi:MAG TPA: FixH family protein [Phnomibacter sp.]|nr:FixH family protein [Phnomibacter sp.]
MTIRFNWGTKIIVAYSAFVIFMLVMVYLCTQQTFNLVAPDYYAQELKYQQVIDATQNARSLEGSTKITQYDEAVSIAIPNAQPGPVKGTVTFYRPSNAALDYELPFEGDAPIKVLKTHLIEGLYKVKVQWSIADKSFYHEEALFVTK